ncbi:DNA-binding response regulator [Halomonas sp. KAO]|uniref:LuxR C-terminal-related transcriptional regulator n=1 Tax=unclassified Halomonas TaxID=2609666 RepID=UPI00189F5E03|nr:MULTISPECIES: LuxR C-terminal-related transcriptional regulator [unclassified Halomonas]MBF7053191.1 DNA-binding response regulator [Halomonas sp. KAO]MDT0499420.1 LuxR C-terminal-related transcriptional regulator [Halomonas sp. PAR7]MDT0510763.1 LuxR C-terminal-related transcriptional regulator [Halomonas sp. LES1]MDT0591708.1 LuxR C-terminal-related transcriptional regulator [Halomonas sp. PAR8]
MSQRNGGVAFVTEQNPQSSLFIDYINDHVDCTVTLLSPADAPSSVAEETSVVLLDHDHVDDALLQAWQEEASSRGHRLCIAALNLKDGDEAAEVLSYAHLSGVFYRTDSLDMICKGIGRLLEGHLWMSRSLMSHLIEFFRKQSINSYRPACGLTQRELEIIGLLGSGASNMQIADRLFVSEHTVKSHLYNIFKKIDVHNRTQAVNWARQNLGAPPPLFHFDQRKGAKRCNHSTP